MSTMSPHGWVHGVSAREGARCLHPRIKRGRRPAWPKAKSQGVQEKANQQTVQMTAAASTLSIAPSRNMRWALTRPLP